MALPTAATAYFEALSAGRFEAAAACFGVDALYSHPAYDPGGGGPTSRRMEGRGRDQIAAIFQARGERDWVHQSRADTVGDRFYVEGVVRTASGEDLLSYLAVGELGADGLIQRYVAYDSRPPVAGWVGPA